MKSFKTFLAEKKDDPCWDNYQQVGMKKKGNKEVPNCVPKEELKGDQHELDHDKDGKITSNDFKGLRKKKAMKESSCGCGPECPCGGDCDANCECDEDCNMKSESTFSPHMMYDADGKAHKAETEADHLKMKKMGYTHEKPEVNEIAPVIGAVARIAARGAKAAAKYSAAKAASKRFANNKSVDEDATTTADVGIPADTKDMGPGMTLQKRHKEMRAYDKRKKKDSAPRILKHFKSM